MKVINQSLIFNVKKKSMVEMATTGPDKGFYHQFRRDKCICGYNFKCYKRRHVSCYGSNCFKCLHYECMRT